MEMSELNEGVHEIRVRDEQEKCEETASGSAAMSVHKFWIGSLLLFSSLLHSKPTEPTHACILYAYKAKTKARLWVPQMLSDHQS